MQKACGPACALVVGREARAKKERKELRERRQKLKTLQDYIDDAQKLVNRLVVREDKPKGCISCPDGEVTDSGHYFHRGSKYRTSWLTLSRLNLNGQCRSCNSFKGGGNQHEYRLGYIARYGEEQFRDLEELKRRTDRREIPKPTIEEVKEFIKGIRRALSKQESME